MGLQQQLDAFKAEFTRTAPATRPALYEAKIEELRAAFARERAIGFNDQAPDFTLPDQQGRPVSLSELPRTGPAVVMFYRGGLVSLLQHLAPRLARRPAGDGRSGRSAGRDLAAAARWLALSTAESNNLTFDVLSDVGNHIARRFGLLWSLPEELRAALRSNKALPGINGDDSWELPVPATYVVARDGRVVLAAIEVDYRKRLEPEAILTALRALCVA